jgi:tRNA threonylcarbamoyladenosine biosynthesis protein TsaE
VAKGLSIPEENPVTSPSYTLLNVHYGRIPLYHFDLYRLSQVDDLADLGYDDFAEGDGLTLVEWADRMTGALSASLSVHIERLGEEDRLVRVTASDDQGEKLLGCLGEV